MRVFAGFLVMASVLGSAGAQEAPCVVVATVARALTPQALLRPTPGGYIPEPLIVPERDVPSETFVAREGLFRRVPIVSVQADEGPRRIVFVEAFGSGWREHARQPAAPNKGLSRAELTAILSVARPQDSFALLVIGGPRVEVPFGSPREALRAGIQAISHPDPDAPEGPGLFDGLLKAASWFGASQIGDSILEIGDVRRWRWDKARAARLRTALVGRGIRLFTLGGAYYTEGTCSEVWDCGSWESPFTVLCGESGGGSQDIGYLGPNARDAMQWEWQEAAKALYRQTTCAYILRLPRTGPRVKIELVPAAKSPWVGVSYPSPLPVCPPPAGPAPPPRQEQK
jgi:hypothetical protein